MKWICYCVTMTLALLASFAQATPLAQCLGFTSADKVLIVNADDVGMHPDLDSAAFKLIDAGQIQTISMMPPTPNFAVAAAMAKKRNMGVGVHLTLTNEWHEKQAWGSVLPKNEVPSLYNRQGRLWATTEEVAQHAKLPEVKKELLAQIAKVQAAGLAVTHLDAHMLFWTASEALSELYFSLARETGIPVVLQGFRLSNAEQMKLTQQFQTQYGVVTPDTFSMHYNPSQRERGVAYRGYFNLISELPAGVHTIGIHPAEDSASAKAAIADLTLRLTDFSAWQDPVLQQHIQSLGFKPLTYAPLHALQRSVVANPKNCLSQYK
nr:polysaccharide deacetylase family protein [uncultured Deefgea sp.]